MPLPPIICDGCPIPGGCPAGCPRDTRRERIASNSGVVPTTVRPFEPDMPQDHVAQFPPIYLNFGGYNYVLAHEQNVRAGVHVVRANG